MKLSVPDISELINKQIKPIVAFTRSTNIIEPIIKLTATKKNLIIDSSSSDRQCKIIVDAEVATKDTIYLPANSLITLKAPYKKATFKTVDNKLVIKAFTKSRKIQMDIDTVSDADFINILNITTKSKLLEDVPITYLKKTFGLVDINPIAVPGMTSSTITMVEHKAKVKGKKKIGVRYYISDSSRSLIFEDMNTNLHIDEELTTDFKEFQNILNVVSSMSDTAKIEISKKNITVTGFDEKGKKELIQAKLNHSIPSGYTFEKIKIVQDQTFKQQPIMGFRPTKEFKNSLENMLQLISSKSKAGFMDIVINKSYVRFKGQGATSSFSERVNIKEGVGKGTVRVQVNVLIDLVKHISPVCLVQVYSSTIVIKNYCDKHTTTYFILPVLRVESKNL